MRGAVMKKQRIEFDSPVDAIISIAKRLCVYEFRYNMTSEDFSESYFKGSLEDTADFTEWANAYQHFLSLRLDIEGQLRHVA